MGARAGLLRSSLTQVMSGFRLRSVPRPTVLPAQMRKMWRETDAAREGRLIRPAESLAAWRAPHRGSLRCECAMQLYIVEFYVSIGVASTCQFLSRAAVSC